MCKEYGTIMSLSPPHLIPPLSLFLSLLLRFSKCTSNYGDSNVHTSGDFVAQCGSLKLSHFPLPGVQTGDPNAVVIGLAPEHFHYQLLNQAFR